ncbi:MAG TPA: mercuric reductase [Puia sp.]|nr:mercuric reductase [Puia sp.]
MKKYDAIIIGSGQAGNPLARKLAAADWKVALIEKRWVGGTCINDGCTPTKSMIASARIAHQIRRSAEFGIHAEGFSVNMEELIDRKNSIVRSFRESLTKGLVATEGVDLIFGNASFSGPQEITVVKEDGSSEILRAEKIFINTGTRPLAPPVEGLGKINYLTSTSIMELMEIPSHLVIVGASYIALEFGQLYRRLGSEVTIIESGKNFLPKEDEDISSEIRKILEEDGIKFLIGTHARRVSYSGSSLSDGVSSEVASAGGSSSDGSRGLISLGLQTGQAEQTITGSHLLVAAGRVADTEGLNTAAAGIMLDEKGFIAVNDRLETNIPGIYALGDVKGGPQFTHISYDDYRIVYKNLLENGHGSTAGRLLNYCLFTDPQLGRIGLSEKEARSRGLSIKIARLPMSSVARGIETSETRGLLKVIINAGDKKIIGAAILAPEGGELMAVLQMAMMGGVTYDKIRDAVYAHPTYAESLNNLFMELDN